MTPGNYSDYSVCIVGLGYVGLTLAVAMADAGFRIHGVERNEDVLAALKEGRAHFSEVGLNAKLAEQIKKNKFSFSASVQADTNASVYIVTVGTPVGADKKTHFASIKTVVEAIANVLKDGDLVILRSTVRVGTTREIVKPILDRAGVRYDLAFCPERTLEGKALFELRTLPQIVGGIDDNATFRASQLFSFMTPSVVRVADLETAELVKLVNNTQRDYLFAFANEVAAMCDVLGLSAAEVIRSGNLGYPRANLPLPGPVGGPCLEKDPYILAEGLERFNFVPGLALAARKWNENLPQWSIESLALEYRRVAAHAPLRVAIVGLAFKGRPETDDLRGSLAMAMIDVLRREFPAAEIVGWDPMVPSEGVRSLGVQPTESLADAFTGSALVLIQNNHPVFENMDIAMLSGLMDKPGIIFDYWNQHDVRSTELAEQVSYRALGSLNLRREMAEA